MNKIELEPLRESFRKGISKLYRWWKEENTPHYHYMINYEYLGKKGKAECVELADNVCEMEITSDLYKEFCTWICGDIQYPKPCGFGVDKDLLKKLKENVRIISIEKLECGCYDEA